MSERLHLRRHLYEQRRGLLRGRAVRRQLRLLDALPPDADGGGTAGVREPRRPLPPGPRSAGA